MRIGILRKYQFVDKDSVIDAIRTIRDDEGLSNADLHAISGHATTTYNGWFDGDVRNPKHAVVTNTAASLGYVRHDTLNKDGTVNVRYVKAQRLDWKDEMEKQADWILKHKPPKKKRKKKTNGSKR